MTHITQRWKLRLIVLAMLATVLITKPDVERYGDNFQIALPIIALGCAATNGQALDFVARYATMMVVVHGSKNLLGDAKINQRPRGGGKGFPSGHTSTAVLGASYLVHSCVDNNIWVKGLAVISAGFVGGSRIAVGAHDIWQVLVGALTGWLCERGFRGRRSLLGWIRHIFALSVGKSRPDHPK